MSAFALRAGTRTSRAVRTAAARASSSRVWSRALHERRPLSYPVEQGLGSFLPAHTLKMLAEDYQQGLLDRLNDHIRGTALESKSIVQTIIDAARDPSKVLEFNYATEALNNSFFLENLKPPPADASSHEDALIATDLAKRINFQFGSLAQLQSNFSAATLGMFSSGWLWLVTDQHRELGIIPTFGPGTLLVRSSEESRAYSEWRLAVSQAAGPQEDPEPTELPLDDIPPPSSSSSSVPPQASSPLTGAPLGGLPPLDPHTPSRSMSQTYAQPRGMHFRELNVGQTDPKALGSTLFPLLCVSVHERAWVSAGYGVWGKEEYMKRFWSVVDWHKVNNVFNSVTVAPAAH